jgi:hypothetical protein
MDNKFENVCSNRWIMKKGKETDTVPVEYDENMNKIKDELKQANEKLQKKDLE